MRARNIIASLALAACAAGCVEREMVITSQPEGALVYVSDVEVGRTPLTLPFTWYGHYDIILRLEGMQTLNVSRKISPPWYEIPPLDLFSALAPWTYHDRRYLHFDLQPLIEPSEDELIRRAEEMQLRNLQPPRR